MAGKGNGRMDIECQKLSIGGVDYPERIPAMGMINLLAGTTDRSSPNWQEWAELVWRKVAPGQRWNGDAPNQADYEAQLVSLLITFTDQARAAQLLKDAGETSDTLSEQVKHWLGDYLDKPSKFRQHPKRRKDLLRQLIKRLKSADPNLDTDAMPGTRANLLELCQKQHPDAFHISPETFKADLRGICSFPAAGARSSDYYQNAQSLLS
jgi:hypothetical protein